MKKPIEYPLQHRVPAISLSPRLAWPAGADVIETSAGDTAVVYGQPYWIGRTMRLAQAAYWVKDRKPVGDGPWSGEADKIVWQDPDVGLRCMILRDDGGRLGGYVAVAAAHPLHGMDQAAIRAGSSKPSLKRLTHFGLGVGGERFTISEEARSIGCTVLCPRLRDSDCFQPPFRRKTDEDWWFGYDSSALASAPPRKGRPARPSSDYRDENETYHAVVDLAYDLHNLAAKRR